ncbi:hypothetical protein M011DRAFT_406095 [Sporormia fimetaria CBS 119925]|uniref:AHC1-like C2H2 zinc-finger domain-containing protein n=1 Tax=Sporormia fimetaria CBS 119925 TaxID=1340428 RepID=A0A6A6V5B2_9PLEO|nr:hypothetical protein M011DRAFT_406095 [Sporormia fimetaria CBS 119925]
MQHMLRVPWGSDAPGMPVDFIFQKLKRQRSPSPASLSQQPAHVTKKFRCANGEVKPVATATSTDSAQVVDGIAPSPRSISHRLDSAVSPASHTLDSQPETHSMPSPMDTDSSKADNVSPPVVPAETSASAQPSPAADNQLSNAQKAIEAQFDYEILLKHNELQLIEQELAKCQIALEQLRRCSLVPYPGTEGLSLAISDGTGPSLQPPAGYTEPQFAAPWGVTDGPYTRHYARWLIPDPKFDSMPQRALSQEFPSHSGFGEGRTTRGSIAEFSASSRSRASRTSTGTSRLQALGENPPPAPKIDPLLHKRSTDGRWVRLFCAQCGHGNFSNTQGFLNHCRIKHNQMYKSHDQAAVACGVPVDVDESGAPLPVMEMSPLAMPTHTASPFSMPAASGSVHPLVRSDPPEWAKDVHRSASKPSPVVKPEPAADFTKEPSVPHLNALLEKRGFEGDFKGLVETARTKVDLSAIEPVDDDESVSSSMATPAATTAHQGLSRLPTATAPAPQPPSSTSQTPGRPPFLPLPGRDRDRPVSPGTPLSPVELSPNTVDSNPGLVSDHDDEDDEDGFDARSQSDIAIHDDVLVQDVSDLDGLHEREGCSKRLEGCFEKGEASSRH